MKTSEQGTGLDRAVTIRLGDLWDVFTEAWECSWKHEQHGNDALPIYMERLVGKDVLESIPPALGDSQSSENGGIWPLITHYSRDGRWEEPAPWSGSAEAPDD